MGWRGGGRNLGRALLRGRLSPLLAAAGGRDTATLKLFDDNGPTWGEYQFTAVSAARR